MVDSIFHLQILEKFLENKKELQGHVLNIYDELSYHFWIQLKRKIFYLALDPAFPFFAVVEDKSLITHPPFPSPFTQTLRHHLNSATILDLHHPLGERILHFTLRKANKLYYLIAEFIPHRTNLILCNEEHIILALLFDRKEKKRVLRPQEIYIPPPPRLKTSLSSPAFSYSWDALRKMQKEKITEKKRQETLRKKQKEKKKILGHLENLRKDEEKIERGETYRKWGELLKANYSSLQKGMKKIRVQDYYQEPFEEIEIPLDPMKSPKENMEEYFKKYKKALRGRSKIAERKKEQELELARIEAEMEEWKTKWVEKIWEMILKEEWIKGENRKNSKKRAKKEEMEQGKKYRKFYSKDHWTILVGKKAEDNDFLTFSIAKGRDFFFHVENTPGSHVILVNPGKEAFIPQETLLDGATLALYFSKKRGKTGGRVLYTSCKNIQKPKKSSPGKVWVTHAHSIEIFLDEKRLQRLLNSMEVKQ